MLAQYTKNRMIEVNCQNPKYKMQIFQVVIVTLLAARKRSKHVPNCSTISFLYNNKEETIIIIRRRRRRKRTTTGTWRRTKKSYFRVRHTGMHAYMPFTCYEKQEREVLNICKVLWRLKKITFTFLFFKINSNAFLPIKLQRILPTVAQRKRDKKHFEPLFSILVNLLSLKGHLRWLHGKKTTVV